MPASDRRAVNRAEAPHPADCRFPRSRRLSRPAEFREAYDRGEKVAGRFMILWLRRGPGAGLRMGVVASKRSFRRAVDRNRAKRLLREAFRLNRHRLAGACDLVLVARRAILGHRTPEVEVDLLEMATRARLIAKQS